jgi:mannitol/fructose-specific phosphotransferase system IIA component (Ntr-type)
VFGMRLGDFFVSTMILDGGPALSKDELIGRLVTRLAETGHILEADVPDVLFAVRRREQLGSTGIGKGLAVPHAKHAAVQRPLGVLAVCRAPVWFDAIDGEPVDVVALLLAPPDRPGQHLGQASQGSEVLVRRLADEAFCRRLRQTESAEEIQEIVQAGDGGMTEEQWLACADPDSMFRYLIGRAGSRKKRLFACACCRHIWHLLPDERCRRAVAVSERYADGLASRAELEQAGQAAGAARQEAFDNYRAAAASVKTHTFPGPPAAWEEPWRVEQAALAALYAVAEQMADSEGGPYQFELRPVFGPHQDVVHHWIAARHAAIAAGNATVGEPWGPPQCAMLRCLFGNPFRPVAFDPTVWQWNGGCAVTLATAMYESHDFSRAPLLADMLEDAGVSDAQLLGHLRGPEPHARGCWFVDLLLDKG